MSDPASKTTRRILDIFEIAARAELIMYFGAGCVIGIEGCLLKARNNVAGILAAVETAENAAQD